MKSISEFIQEQETGVTMVSTDNFVKSYCDCMAAISLAQCYAEHAVIMEFAAENGINSLAIVQEADEEKKGNIFKRAGIAIKGAWGKLVKLIKGVVDSIKRKFTKKKLESIAAKLEKRNPDEKIKVDLAVFAPVAVLEILDDIFEVVKDYGTNAFNQKLADEFNTFANAIGSKGPVQGLGDLANAKHMTYNSEALAKLAGKYQLEDGKNVAEITVYDFTEMVKRVVKTNIDDLSNKVNKKLDELAKKIEDNLNDDDMYTNDLDGSVDYQQKEEALRNDKTVPEAKAAVDAGKKFVNALTKCYDAGMKAFESTEASLQKSIKADIKKEEMEAEDAKNAETQTTESFYFV